MAVDEHLVRKIVGDAGSEAPEAMYRIISSQLVKRARVKAAQRVGARFNKDSKQIQALLETDYGEAALSFALSMLLELIPTPALQEERRHVAHHLRVQAYQAVGELALEFIGLGVDEDLAALLRKPDGEAPPVEARDA